MGTGIRLKSSQGQMEDVEVVGVEAGRPVGAVRRWGVDAVGDVVDVAADLI